MNVSHETFTLLVRREFAALSDQKLGQLNAYAELLEKTALPTGLIGANSDPFDHILRALALIEAFPDEAHELDDGPHLIDVGSGAGLPGVPLAVLLGSAVLVEPKRKAVAFLEKVKRDLGLRLEVVAMTAQQAKASGFGDSADVVTARALASSRRAIELCAGLCRPGGRILLTGGPASRDATSTTVEAGEGLAEMETITVGKGLDIRQQVNIVRKTSLDIA